MLLEDFGRVIARRRKEKGWTLKKLSETSTASIGFLSEIEANKKLPSLPMVAALASAFSTTAADLINEAEQAGG